MLDNDLSVTNVQGSMNVNYMNTQMSAAGQSAIVAETTARELKGLNVKVPKDINKSEDKLKLSEPTKINDEDSIMSDEKFFQRLDTEIARVNNDMRFVNKDMSYSIHPATNRVIVKIYNSETKELVREVPSEKELDLFAKLQELAGLEIDKKL